MRPQKPKTGKRKRRVRVTFAAAPLPPALADPTADGDSVEWPPKKRRRPVYGRQREESPLMATESKAEPDSQRLEANAEGQRGNAHTDDHQQPMEVELLASPLVEIQPHKYEAKEQPQPPPDPMFIDFVRQQFLDTSEFENIPPEHSEVEPTEVDEESEHSDDAENSFQNGKQEAMLEFELVLNSISGAGSLEDLTAVGELPAGVPAYEPTALSQQSPAAPSDGPTGYHRNLFRKTISRRQSRRHRGRGRPRRRATELRIHRRMAQATVAQTNPAATN